jgi:predicted nucleotidyltransferase
MNVDPQSQIAGYAALRIRSLLKQLQQDIFSVVSITQKMAVSPTQSRRLLEELQALGLIEEAPEAAPPWDQRKLFRLTAAGCRLANASGARPVHRNTAEKKLGDFLTHVREVNSNAYWLYQVKEVRLFGSLLSTKERVSDVDLAIELQSKIADLQERRKQEAQRVQEAMRAGRRLASIFDQVLWPKHEILLFLKSRSRVLSLHEIDDLEELGAEYKTIFSLSHNET